MRQITLQTDRQELFGQLDASDERDEIFKNYFLETDIYMKMKSNKNFYILIGEKGTGKSAIMKMCMINDRENGRICIDLRRLLAEFEANDSINVKIEKWKDRLSNEIKNSIKNNQLEILKEKSLKNKLCGVVEPIFEEIVSGVLSQQNIQYDIIRKKIFDIFEQRKVEIKVYIDDLDTGYRGNAQQDEAIIALFTAIKEMIRKNRNLQFRVTLRNDVYDNIRRIDESSDKIQDAILPLKITNHQIFSMLTKRIVSFVNVDSDAIIRDFVDMTQKDMLNQMSMLFEPYFEGRGKWRHREMSYILMTMTRKRPRDLFVLCGLAWEESKKDRRVKICSKDLQNIFTEYSNERLKDAISEYNHEFHNKDDFEELILALKPSEKQKKDKGQNRNIYTKEELINKIKTITERKNFLLSGKKANNVQLARMLYKSNVVVGRQDLEGKIRRLYYMDKPDLMSEITDYGCKFEVHPAYRWAIEALT